MRRVTADVARATIATLMLGPVSEDAAVGEIVLHPHQVDAVGLVRRVLDEERGALLADDVGLGKTFTALALARSRRTLAIVPAGLRAVWLDAARRADVELEITTFDALSRGVSVLSAPELVIIDEAHHLRNPDSLRFAAARAVCGEARVLLLTATPIQNSEADLRVLLSLFLGERAHALPVAELSRYIVRRTARTIGQIGAALPAVAEPQWLDPIDDADCLDRILGLPPAVPPRGGGDAGMLGAYSLARQWASSRAALEGALRRRLARGLAITDALRAGVLPSRQELNAWVLADGEQQLAFPELVVGDRAESLTGVLDHVEAHVTGLRQLLAWLRVTADPDEARVARLCAILLRHPGQRIVAFSEFAETIASIFARLSREARTAMLTHTGGRVAGGPLSRNDVLARFAPGATVADAERIDVLLTTDVLSEGVGLHAASVVVHLDLAWNPARLAQRVGRLRRLGARGSVVHVYFMPPPAPTERLIRIESRLRAKVQDADRTIGVPGSILPGPSASDEPANVPNQVSAVLAGWRGATAAEVPICGGVEGAIVCALLCVRDGGGQRLLAWTGDRISASPDDVARTLELAAGPDAPVPDALVNEIVRQAMAWLDGHGVRTVVDLTALRVARSRRTVLHRADRISRRTPRHARTRIAALVRAARAAATATLSAGAERVLDELARAPLTDDAWLHAVGQFAELHARPASERRIDAVLVVTPRLDR
jgi:superfamily II DNA or RNA helicase